MPKRCGVAARRAEAIAQLEEAGRLAGDDASLLARLADMRLAAGQLDACRRDADQALKLDPKSAAAWQVRGGIARAAGQPREALAAYLRALGYAPNDRAILWEIAELHRQLNQPEQALQTLQSLADTYSSGEEPSNVLYAMGLAYVALGRYDDGVESLAAAVSRGNPTPELLCHLGEAQLMAGRRAEAAAAAERALALEPRHEQSRALLDRIQLAQETERRCRGDGWETRACEKCNILPKPCRTREHLRCVTDLHPVPQPASAIPRFYRLTPWHSLSAALWFRCRLAGKHAGPQRRRGVVRRAGVAACFMAARSIGTRRPAIRSIRCSLVHWRSCTWHFRRRSRCLRSVALVSGLAALAINWLLCRRVFDSRTAAVSTVALAVLPINIAYSRFAWDASQSLAATLPVIYCALGAVRYADRFGRWIAASMLALAIAVWVHPTNVFAGAAIVVAVPRRTARQSKNG